MDKLFGSYSVSVDEKGRVVVPVEFRNEISTDVYLTGSGYIRASIKCENLSEGRFVCMYDESSYKELYAITRSSPKFSLFTSSIEKRTPDNQGRISIPKELRVYAGITDKATVVGVDDRIEIWDHDAFEEFKKNILDTNAQ
ncbi:MAG: hypothetical protein HZB67_03570 [Candidatus Aenigmarchaeota archaeon]|nr:hypothetical protein [Candidatus Aenigmarchaeota archaeon]